MSELEPGQTPEAPKTPESAAAAAVPEQEDFSFRRDRLENASALYRWIIGIERFVAATFLVGVLALVLTQVVSRYVFNSPFSWTEESARLLLVWLTFLAAMHVSSRRAHITVDLIATVVPARAARSVSAVAEIVVIVTAIVMSVAGIMMVGIVGGLALPATGLPTTLLYGAALVGFVGIAIHSLLALYLQIRHPEDELDPAAKAAELEGI